MRTLLLLAACIVAGRCLQSIDTVDPIVRFPPDDLDMDGYFGYSVVIHQLADSSDFADSLQNTV